MSAKLIFVRRSQEQIDIFGGEVFADVDGKKVATIGTETITYEVPAGRHIVKMYKSHEYGSMIGFAESEFTINDNEALVFNYSPPMKVTQPGHIVVSDFTSYEEIENEVATTAKVIAKEKADARKTAEEAGKAIAHNQIAWWVLIFVIPAIFWAIYEFMIMSSIF